MNTSGTTQHVAIPFRKHLTLASRIRTAWKSCGDGLWRSLAFSLVVSTVCPGQSARMAVEGSIQLDGADVPPSTLVRALRNDGSIARTIIPYTSNPSRFGVRFSSGDGFLIGEEISFRVVLSKRDSFLARIAGPPVLFSPSPQQDISVNRILLYRNHLPQIRRPVPDTTISELEVFRFKLTAQDVDGDTLVYRFINAPEGAWIDSRNGFMTWTPSYDQSGVYECVVGVSDGLQEAYTGAALLSVTNVNRPPRLSSVLTDKEVAEGDVLVFQVEALDADEDSLLYFLFEKDHKTLLYSEDGIFNWRPGFDASGSYEFIAVVSDGMTADTSSPFSIRVSNTNRTPMFDEVLVDTVVTEGMQWRHTFTASDPDGDFVRYELQLAPEGVEIDASGSLSWTPDYDQAGSYVIIVSASDPFGLSEAVVRVSVLNLNRPPEFVQAARPRRNGIQEVVEGSIVDLSWSPPRDPDADDTLRYSIRLFGSGLDTSLTDIVDTTISLFGTGRFKSGRDYHWLVTVTDGYAQTSFPDTFTFRILPPQTVFRDEPAPTDVTFSFMLSYSESSDQNSVTTIRYSLAERSQIRLAVYTMLGDRVSTIEDGERNAGRYTTHFDAGSLSSGIYMFKLEAHPLEGSRLKDFVSTKKMVLVR